MKFHKIISDFRNKLASTKGQEETTMSDIDAFYNNLNEFNSSFVLFGKYYRKYIANLNRLRPQPEDGPPDLTLLRVALAENKWKPTTPFAIFVHYIKYENKLTSKPFVARQKKQNLKKLNTPIAKANLTDKPKSTKEWIRVPMPGNPPRE